MFALDGPRISLDKLGIARGFDLAVRWTDKAEVAVTFDDPKFDPLQGIMMVRTQTHEIVEARGTAVGPVFDVVTLDLTRSAARKTTTAVPGA
jgi:hypothetical protein